MAAIDFARPIFKRREPPRPPITAEDLEALQRDLEAMAQAPSVPQVAPVVSFPPVEVSPEPWEPPRVPSFTPGRYPGTTGEPLPYSTTPAPPISEVEQRARSVYERSPALQPEPFDLGALARGIPGAVGKALTAGYPGYGESPRMAPSPELNLPFGYQSQEEVNRAQEMVRETSEGPLGVLGALPPYIGPAIAVQAARTPLQAALRIGLEAAGQPIREAPIAAARAGAEAGMAVGQAMEATARPGAAVVQVGRKGAKPKVFKPIEEMEKLTAAQRWALQDEVLQEAGQFHTLLKATAIANGLGTEASLKGQSIPKVLRLLREHGVKIPPRKGIAELPPEWETRVAEGAQRIGSRISEGVRLDYPGGEAAARERVTALRRALQDPDMSEVRRSEILDQELPYLQAFLSQPAPYQYPVPVPGASRRGMPTIQQSALERQRATQTDWELRARAAETARAADDARGGAGVAERAEQAGFDVEGQPVTVPFESEVRSELLPQTVEGIQQRLPLSEDFYKAPGLTLQEEALLAQAVKRGDRKTIQRLTRRGQGQLMEERLPYSANGAYELSPDAITTNPLHQPRKGLDEANVQRIVENYDPNRFLPIEVRELNPGVFELIHGHHRLEAARRLALKRIPARVLNVSSEDAIRLAEEANLAGQPLKPTEIARLLDKRLRQAQSSVEIVRAFPGAGIRAGQVEDYARIVNLPRTILEAVDDPVLSRQFTVQHAMRLAKAQQKYSMPADEVQAFFNEVIMKQEMTPAQMERVLDNFAPVLRKESESQGALFGGGDFQGTYTGIMATIRGAVGDIKSLELLERRMKGIVSFIEAGKEVPEELAAARAPLERQIAGVRQRIVQAQKAVTGEIHAERGAAKPPAPEAPAGVAAKQPLPRVKASDLAKLRDLGLQTQEARGVIQGTLDPFDAAISLLARKGIRRDPTAATGWSIYSAEGERFIGHDIGGIGHRELISAKLDELEAAIDRFAPPEGSRAYQLQTEAIGGEQFAAEFNAQTDALLAEADRLSQAARGAGKQPLSRAEQFREGLFARGVFEGGEIQPDVGYAWRSMGKAEYDGIVSGKPFGGGIEKRGGYWSWFPGYPVQLKGQPGGPKYLVEVRGEVEGEFLTTRHSVTDITGVWKNEGKEWVKQELPEAARAAEPPVTAAGEELPTGGGARKLTRQELQDALGLEGGRLPPPESISAGGGFEYSVPTSLVRENVVPGDMLTIPQFYPEQRHLIDLISSSNAFTSLEPVETTIERLTRTAQWDENDVVDAIFTMKKLGERGDLKAIADFNLVMRDKGRATGRNVQAWAAMAKMSPEGNLQDALNVLAEVLGKPVRGTQQAIEKAAKGLPGKATEVAKKQGDELIAEAERLTAAGKADVAATRARATKAAKAEANPESAVAPPKTPVAALNRLDRAVQYLENEGRAPGMPRNADELMAQLARTRRLAQETGWLMEHPEATGWLDQVEAVWKLPAGERNTAARNLIQQLVDTHLPTMEARSVAWKEASANLKRIDQAAAYLSSRGRAPGMPKIANEWAAAFTKVKRLAQQTGWIMEDTQVKAWLDQADLTVSMGVGQAQVDATKAFIASTRDTLIPYLESLKKTQAELLREARYKEIMTGKLIPEAKQRAVNLTRDAQNRSQQIVLKNGLALDPDVAAAFWERSQNIAKLPPGMQQNREYARFMADVKNFIPPSKWNLVLDLYGLPVGLKTMWDAGWLVRQGALLGMRHPGLWVDQLKSMGKLWSDPVFAVAKQDQLAARPLANLVDEMGGIFDEIWATNEFFASKLGNKVPGMKGSQRTFVVPGNELRLRGIDQEVMNWLTKPDGKAWDFAVDGPVNSIADLTRITGKTEQEAKDMAMLYNALSGKSNIEWLRSQKGFLRLPFFAPGWALSLPEAALRSTVMGTAKGTGAGILAKYFGSVAAIEAMGDLAGIWDAELDPRSPNFGKVRWKGTQSYTDPTLGLAAWLRLVAQIVPTPTEKGWGQWHKTAAGKFVPQDTGDIFLNHFLRGKTHPIPGELWSWAEGQNIVGEKRAFTGANAETALSVFNTAKSLFAPLTPVDIIEGVINDGLIGGVIGAMNIPGLNASSYTTFGDQQQKVTDELFPGKKYRELPKGDQNRVNDSAEIKLAIAKFDEGPGVKLKDKVTVLYDTLEQGKHSIEYGVPATATEPAKPGLKDYIDAGMLPGKAMKEKIRDARNALYILSSNLLTPEVLAYSSTNDAKPLVDVYALKWLTVPLDENLETGELNFRKRDLERQQILLEAQDALKAAGKTSAYITERGEGSYRRKQFTDPKVQAMVDQYDAAQETLRPYWEVRDWAEQSIPVSANPLVEVQRAKARDRLIDRKREAMRNTNSEVRIAWEKWGYGKPRVPIVPVEGGIGGNIPIGSPVGGTPIGGTSIGQPVPTPTGLGALEGLRLRKPLPTGPAGVGR